MKNTFIILLVFFLSPIGLYAQVYISEIMPNTDDDANMEYIDIINTACESIDIWGYSIADKEKSYTFAAGSTLASHEKYRLSRPISKIILNNTNEELILRNKEGDIISSYSYASSTKGIPISIHTNLEECTDSESEESDDTETQESEGSENPETPNPEKPESEKPESEKPESEKPESEKPNPEKPESEKPESENPESEKPNPEKPNLEKPESDAHEPKTPDPEIPKINILWKSWSLLPQVLLYSDSDWDNRIDTLEILYDIYLTGSVDISRIFLYSNTWWLYEERINTMTWYILDAEIEENILRLFIEPSHFEKNTLIHDATTKSDIRLKSSGGFGITSFSWLLLEDFLLTSSFESYREVYEKWKYESLLSEIDTENTTTQNNSWTLSVSFPDIVPTIQNYTNTTLSGNTFICRETPCRLNLNFESIFGTTYSPSSYSCRVSYGWVVEEKCNPPQWNPTQAWSFAVRIIHKATGQYREQYFPIEWNIISTSNASSARTSSLDYAPPVPRITLNGKLTKTQIEKNENHILCYTNTCALNFDGSDTYDPDGSTMTYSWTVSGSVFSTRKNPTIQEFGIGEHIVVFVVTDASWKTARDEFRVSVYWDMTLPPDTEMMIASSTSEASQVPKKKKKQAMSFFAPPELVVEKASDGFTKKDNGYVCVTTGASCSFNFALTWTTSWVYYRFSYAHEPSPLYTANPRSKSFQAGKYVLIVSAHYEKDAEPIWQQPFPIEIIRVKKPKATKTTTQNTKTASVAKSSNTLEVIPTAYADDGSSWGSSSGLILSFLFFSLLLNSFFLTRRKSNNV
jgi:hypothetical protein